MPRAKQPIGQTKAAQRIARDLTRRISQEDFVRHCQFLPEEIAILGQIASGKPPRNAYAIIKALQLKADFAYSKPKQVVDVNVSLGERVVAARRRAAEHFHAVGD